jgi:hypothetical protein
MLNFNEAELLVALQHLTEAQLLEITSGFDRGVKSRSFRPVAAASIMPIKMVV